MNRRSKINRDRVQGRSQDRNRMRSPSIGSFTGHRKKSSSVNRVRKTKNNLTFPSFQVDPTTVIEKGK